MSANLIHTTRLKLIPMTRVDSLAMVETLSPSERAEVSAEWLTQVRASTAENPWIHGFSIMLQESGQTIGMCGFKGPPSEDGMVEIAYGIDPIHQGNGYASEAAEALLAFAFESGQVKVVRAHTLPERNASTRVLTKCGFLYLGEVIDPEDGLVWRWETAR